MAKNTFLRHMAFAIITCLLLGGTAESISEDRLPILDHFEERWIQIESFETDNHLRAAESHNVDYGGNHPFEILERRRLRESKVDVSAEVQTVSSIDSDERNLSPWSAGSIFKPLRIHFDMTFIEEMEDNDQYTEHIAVLKNEILPRVQVKFETALHVFRATENIVIKSNQCPFSSSAQLDVGIPDSDLVIFIAANFDLVCKDSSALAAARSCQADQYDKPNVGIVILCLDRLDVNYEESKNTFYYTILHEMTHVLGIRAIDFPFYHDHATGLPRTPRPFEPQLVTCVDGNVIRIAPPSSSTLKAGYTKRGNLYYEIVTPTVRQVVRNHFDCQSMHGARLENQPTNDGNCFGSHVEARLFATDVVAAIKVKIMQHLTPLTLAILEDSGWYKAQFEIAEISPFGHGKGCDFVNGDCIVNGEVPEWGKGTFCNEISGPFASQRCDLSHSYITRCDLVDFADYPGSTPPDRSHQYFPDNPTWGGLMHTADYCPMNLIPVKSTNSDIGVFEFHCQNETITSSVSAEYYGEGSRCIESNTVRPLCMQMICDADIQKIIIYANNVPIICQNDGDFMNIPGAGAGNVPTDAKIQCPILKIACPNFGCPSNCRGRGVCDFSETDPFCKCCNSDDPSDDCRYSTICEMDIENAPIGNFFCGVSSLDASSCSAGSDCPGGKNSECESDEFCYDVLECKVNNYHCGPTIGVAAQCSTVCPSGSDDQCAVGESCYDVPSCDGLVNVDGEKYCGDNFQDASQCLAQCRSDGECPGSTTCYVVSNCIDSDSKYCGTSPVNAGDCNTSCPNGHVDCAADELCYVVNECKDDTNTDPIDEVPIPMYCGLDIHDAAQCGQSCDNDADCSGGKSCIGVENCNQFCASTLSNAAQCSVSCPSGRNSECLPDQQCFEVLSCNMYCGSTLTAASTCGQSCLSGSDDECPIGESCHHVDNCNMFCGSTLSAAATCSQACPSGQSNDCAIGEQCMEVQKCNKFCGSSLAGASQCSVACPSGEDSECPFGEQCRDVQNCNKFCGSSLAAASECSLGCPSGLDSDCPFGQQCSDVEKCNMYCGSTISAASTCGISCPSGSDTDCPSGDTCHFVENCNKFCGDSLGSAASCSLSCPAGTDDECPGSEQCYAVDQCSDPEGEGKLFFCGDTNDPNSCRAPGQLCADQPSGGCGAGEYCFYDPPCNDDIPSNGNYFCGENLPFASYCTQACPSGLNGECPYGQQCFSVDTCQDQTMSPIESPVARPRNSVKAFYTFCLEHGLLTPTYKLERKSSESITKTMINKFIDSEQDVEARWKIVETHLTVKSVETTWLEQTPEYLDCKCEAGDDSSTCSPVESEAVIEFWEELDPDLMRYILLMFQPAVTNGMKYTATYWGSMPFESDRRVQLYGVPEPIMSAETQDTFQGILKQYLNEDLANMNIPGLEVLVVMVNSVQKLGGRSRSLSRSTRGRSLEELGVDVDTTFAGQYKPPPDVDVGKLVGDSLERGSKKITQELKQSGDPYFENLTIIVDKESNEEDGEKTDTKKKSKSKVAIIFIVLFLILFLAVLAVVAIIFYRRKKENKHETQNILDNDADATNDYGDFYGKNAEHYELNGSVVTDPTYRGGEYDLASKQGNDEEQFYEIENMYDDEDDAGTFAGQSIHPGSNADDMSALMSVRGVEDAWITETIRTDTDHNTDHDTAALRSTAESQYGSYTSGYGGDGNSNYDGYQSQGTGYYSKQSGNDSSYTSAYTSKLAREDPRQDSYSDGENTYEEDESLTFISMASAPTVTKRDDFRRPHADMNNISAPNLFKGQSTSQKMSSASSPNLTANESHQLTNNTADNYTDESDLQSYASAPTVYLEGNDDMSLISMDSFASAPTVTAEQPIVTRAAKRNSFSNVPPHSSLAALPKINEEEEQGDSRPSVFRGDHATTSLSNEENANDMGLNKNLRAFNPSNNQSKSADREALEDGSTHIPRTTRLESIKGNQYGVSTDIMSPSDRNHNLEREELADGTMVAEDNQYGDMAYDKSNTERNQYSGGELIADRIVTAEGNQYGDMAYDKSNTERNQYSGGELIADRIVTTEGNQYGDMAYGKSNTERNQYSGGELIADRIVTAEDNQYEDMAYDKSTTERNQYLEGPSLEDNVMLPEGNQYGDMAYGKSNTERNQYSEVTSLEDNAMLPEGNQYGDMAYGKSNTERNQYSEGTSPEDNPMFNY